MAKHRSGRLGERCGKEIAGNGATCRFDLVSGCWVQVVQVCVSSMGGLEREIQKNSDHSILRFGQLGGLLSEVSINLEIRM